MIRRHIHGWHFGCGACRRQFPGLARQFGSTGGVLRRTGWQSGSPMCDRSRADCLAIAMPTKEAYSRPAEKLGHSSMKPVVQLLTYLGPGCRRDRVRAEHDLPTFALSRSLSKTWPQGDEMIVTRLDHDANVSPWVLAAAETGATVRLYRRRSGELHTSPRQTRRTSEPADPSDRRRTRIQCGWDRSTRFATSLKKAHGVGSVGFRGRGPLCPISRQRCRSSGPISLRVLLQVFGPHLGILWGRRNTSNGFRPTRCGRHSMRFPALDDGHAEFRRHCRTHAAVTYLARLGK